MQPGAEARGGKQGPGPPLQYLPLQYFFFPVLGNWVIK